MAQAVIGGIITSTLLTLVVVPVAYTYTDYLAARVKRKLGRGVEIAPAPQPVGAE